MTAAAQPAMRSAAERQPRRSTKAASMGRKMSWPVAVEAVSTPMTTPRCAVNQRLTMVAPSTSAVMPVPEPTRTPHSMTSCQEADMRVVSATAVDTRSREPAMTRRTPKRFMSSAANGPIKP